MNYSYKWTLKDANFTKDRGKAFSCFSCGGGSTMGYKLAGFDVIGCNEIDPKMMDAYIKNHNPKYPYLEPIQEFKLRKDLPKELYELDIMDGSPPCSSFSMVGVRERFWGVERKFKEGQAEQVLDTLFFDFIDLVEKSQPKVAIAENVKGMLLGNAIEYVRKVYESFDKAGYYCQHYLLDASEMGVPQRRERVFFVCLRKDLAKPFLQPINFFEEKPALELSFNEPKILLGEFADYQGREISKNMKKIWEHRQKEDIDLSLANIRLNGKRAYYGQQYIKSDEVAKTLTSHEDSLLHFDVPKYTSTSEACSIGSFPQDYDFCGIKPHYIIGMSVPPIMVAQIANQIYHQWLKHI